MLKLIALVVVEFILTSVFGDIKLRTKGSQNCVLLCCHNCVSWIITAYSQNHNCAQLGNAVMITARRFANSRSNKNRHKILNASAIFASPNPVLPCGSMINHVIVCCCIVKQRQIARKWQLECTVGMSRMYFSISFALGSTVSCRRLIVADSAPLVARFFAGASVLVYNIIPSQFGRNMVMFLLKTTRRQQTEPESFEKKKDLVLPLAGLNESSESV